MHKLRTLREKVAALVSKQETDLAREHESVCCFVTFENDEGKDFCVKHFKEQRKRLQKGCCSRSSPADYDHLATLSKFRGDFIDVRRAPEPTQIKFENLEKEKSKVRRERSDLEEDATAKRARAAQWAGVQPTAGGASCPSSGQARER
jgi:hypothetical protein